jgi:hypothetical protein
VGIVPREQGVEGTDLQEDARPRKVEDTAPQEGGIVQEQAHPWEEGNVQQVRANLRAVGRILGPQVKLGRRGRLENRAQQKGAGTDPLGVNIGRTGPQGVGIDPAADNSPDKHKAVAVGNIGLGVGSIQVVLVVRHILLGEHKGMGRVVGQAHRLGVGRALDPLEAR